MNWTVIMSSICSMCIWHELRTICNLTIYLVQSKENFHLAESCQLLCWCHLFTTAAIGTARLPQSEMWQFLVEIWCIVNERCLRSWFYTARLYWVGDNLGLWDILWIARLVDQQSSALQLCYGCPHRCIIKTFFLPRNGNGIISLPTNHLITITKR